MTADPLLLRTLVLFEPALLLLIVWLWRRPGKRARAGALLSAAWAAPALLALHLLAQRAGWWRFEAEGGLLLGAPVDLYLGWILLWGPLPAIALPRAQLVAQLGLLLAIDVLAMPLMAPVVQLGDRWLIGEVLGLALVAAPALLLARWTRQDRRLAWRALGQVLAFSGLTLFVMTAGILEQTGGAWAALLDRPPWLTLLGFNLLIVPAVVGLSAVQEFAERGGGTPVPFDPPRRLVNTGVYAYLANPMQSSMALVFLGWGALLDSGWLVLAAVVTAVYGAGFAAWSERGDLSARFGADWRVYRRQVRAWRPRWRPWRPEGTMARLYLAEGCLPCSELAAWFGRRDPVGLQLVAAEDHPARDLRRITYDPGDGGLEEEGLVAVARTLEHLHLGWAWLGWLLRLPVVRPVAQLLMDAVGGEPRPVKRRQAVRHR